MAVIKKIWFPQTTGLEWPKPGIGTFQRMFSDFSAFQVVAVSNPSAMPQAFVPRKEGQLMDLAVPSGFEATAEVGRRQIMAERSSFRFMVYSKGRAGVILTHGRADYTRSREDTKNGGLATDEHR